MIAWIDIETTGLDPRSRALLEVGLVVTSDDLEVVREEYVVVRPYADDGSLVFDPTVEEMHAASGLLVASMAAGWMVSAVEDRLITALDEAGVTSENAPPMGGSSVHFDRAWLKVWLPRFEARFGYRNVDISSVRELAKRWRPDLTGQEPGNRKIHRVQQDLEDTLALARFYREHLFKIEVTNA